MNLNKMHELENLFPVYFSQLHKREYGLLFHNKACPFSYDTNHAVITDLSCDLDYAIKDIIKFYTDRQIEPRIYQGFIIGEMDILEPVLKRNGFEVELDDDTMFFTHLKASAITPVSGMEFKRLLSPEEGVDEIVMSGIKVLSKDKETGYSADWWKTFTANVIKVDHLHMLVGYIGDRAVTMASVNIMDGFSRIDDVKTHTDYWGRGYSSTLIDYLVKYHSAISDNVLYLYASNPAAIKVYKNAGFVRHIEMPPSWNAWKPL